MSGIPACQHPERHFDGVLRVIARHCTITFRKRILHLRDPRFEIRDYIAGGFA